MNRASQIRLVSVTATVLSLALLAPAQAQSVATATANVTIRSGPGPSFPIIGNIRPRRSATIVGCVAGSLWCQVNYRGVNGWAFARNLALAPTGQQQFVVTETLPNVTSTVTLPNVAPTVTTFSAPAITAFETFRRAPATTQVVGEIVSAPARAAFAAAPPFTTGAVTSAPQVTGEILSTPARDAFAAVPTVSPPQSVSNFVVSNPLQPVRFGTDVTVGTIMPRTASLQLIPNYRYQYLYVNGQPVLVDPVSRQIVYVFP